MSSAGYKNSQLTQPLLLLQSLNYSHGPLLDLPCLSCTEEPQTGHKIQTCFTRAKWRGKGHFTSSPAGNALPGCICRMQPGMSLAFFATRVHCWLMVNLSSRPPWGFLCTAAFQLEGPQPALVHGVTPSQAQDFAHLTAELHEIPVSPLLQPDEVPLSGSTNTGCTIHLAPAFYHLQTCWGCTLSHHPNH